MRTILPCTLAAALLAACASSTASVSPARYENRAPVTVVNDRLDTPEVPADNEFFPLLYYGDRMFFEAFDNVLAVPAPTRALNVNSMGEVPDSTWFTNRDVGALTPEQVARGPNVDENPERYTPWKIKNTKTEGVSVGFIVEDARGYTYVVKFDMPEYPEAETGADVIVARIMYALGYNVPQDYVAYIRPEDLVLTEKSEMEDPRSGDVDHMTPADLKERLEEVHHDKDGRIRALASKFIPGKPLGGHTVEGTREGDPNDTVPHQHRRELRGLYPVFSWLQHTDVKANNSLDSWIEDPGNPGQHFVLHYWLDFGKSLGVSPYTGRRKEAGYQHVFAFRDILAKMLTAGLYPYPYERARLTGITGVGLYDVDNYEPAGYASNVPYTPFAYRDRFDSFWGAKLMMQLTPAQLRAAVGEARFSDPRAPEYMTRTLIGRQRKAARYYFRLVNPVDRLEVVEAGQGWTLCFDDLTLTYQLEDVAAATSYRARSFDHGGNALGWDVRVNPAPGGRSCVSGFQPAPDAEGYTIVQLVTRRGDEVLPPTEVHLARNPASGDLRIIGLNRR